MGKIFREKSLQRLANPEQLDQVFKLVSPLNWVLLGTLLLLLTVALIWSVFGSVSTQVTGQGILISRDQKIYDATAESAGRVDAILVRVGDHVQKGQVVAKLDLPLLDLDIENKQQQLHDLTAQYHEMAKFVEEDHSLAIKHNDILISNWQKDIENADRHLTYLKEALHEREKLKGIALTNQQLADMRSQYYKEIQARDAIAHKINESKIQLERQHEQSRDRLRQLHNQVQQAKRELAQLYHQYKVYSEVTSPAKGDVIEISSSVGALTQKGQKLIDIEGADEEMDAAIYIPAAQGKQVKPHMVIHVVPSTVKKQEYGSILGKVKEVSRFPSSQAGMMAVLNNQKLVESFLQSGPQLFIRADLIEDESTPSGYKWTSSKGPDLEISNGTLVTADITVKTQAPITLLLPALKQLFGLE